MMEPVEFAEMVDPKSLPPKPWALTGCKGRKPNIITSLFLDPMKMEELNQRMYRKYKQMEKEEKRWEYYNVTNKMKLLAFAYGMTARISKTAIDDLKKEGIEVGLVRPITLYPFPNEAVAEAAEKAEKLISVELSTGQMIDDIRLSVGSRKVEFFGRQGGMVPTPSEVKGEFLKAINA